MFEIESKNPEEITINTKTTSITFNFVDFMIDANLNVGKIYGPGEFEIGDATIRAIDVKKGKTIYDVEVLGVHVGILGDIVDGLDDLGMANILCTSSIRAVREIEPKIVIATGNVDEMVSELKLTAEVEKKVKVKNVDSLPTSLRVVILK